MKKDNNYIFFFVTHMYLVKTSGIYYLMELSANYKIVLFINDIYTQDQKVYDEIKKLKIHRIIHLKAIKSTILQHHYYHKIFSFTLNNYPPQFIFLDNYVDTPTKYIIFLSRLLVPKTVILKYQNGIYSDESDYYKFQFDKRLTYYSKKYLIPKFILKVIVKFLKALRNYLYNIIIPFYTLFPLLNLTKIKNEFNNVLNYNYLLLYSAFDQLKVRNFSSEIKTIIIEHPLTTNTIENKSIQLSKKKNILILPSFIGLDTFELEEYNLLFWRSIIKAIESSFIDYHLHLKLHPRSKNNKDYSTIIEFLKKDFNDIIILDPSLSAEDLIRDYTIIIGDVSTILWFASLMKKVVISIKIPNVPNNDLMKHYEGIFFIENINELKDIYTYIESEDFKSQEKKSNLMYPSINDVLTSIYNK